MNKKLLHLSSEKRIQSSREISIGGQNLINFSSYSYLGLEHDQRLKQGGKDAIDKYGTQFGASRAYVSIELYEELEHSFELIFGKPCLLAPTTTLAHQAILPIIIGEKDHIIMDQYVHASVQSTVKMVANGSNTTELIRHNDLESLEKSILRVGNKSEKIWYLLDGVYSMQGDFAPLDKLHELTKKYPQLHLYIDDAHGMSWMGEHGKGFAMTNIDVSDQVYVVASLNKAFSGCGGVMIFPNEEEKRRVRTCGGPMIFSTPVPPPMLGVNKAAAEIHLSDDIYRLQQGLSLNTAFTREVLNEMHLPDISNTQSPIFFVAVGQPKVTHNLVHKCKENGLYVTPAIFPAVSMRKSGIRFCVNADHTTDDIYQLTDVLAKSYNQAFKEEGVDVSKTSRLFGMELQRPEERVVETSLEEPKELKLQVDTTIQKINQAEWDGMFGNRGSFDHDGLKFLEGVYAHQEEKENNWNFYYLTVRDNTDRVVLSTFLTATWAKDDMFSSASISKYLEEERAINPYFMCSKSLVLGTLLTEGDHMYIDESHEKWQQALEMVLSEIEQIRIAEEATSVYLRDFDFENKSLNDIFLGEGYIKLDLPNSNIIPEDMLKWDTVEVYLSRLSKNSRQNAKRYAVRYEDYFNVEIVENATPEQLDQWYELYKNVKDKSYELNTFDVPRRFFEEALHHPNWEIIQLSLKPEHDMRSHNTPVLVGLCYKSKDAYCPMVVGMDYEYLFAYKVYRQGIFQVVKRANQLGVGKVYFGFTADIEKRNFGATAEQRVAYIQTVDTYKMKQLDLINSNESAVLV